MKKMEILLTGLAIPFLLLLSDVLPAHGQPAAPRDFSKTNSVTLFLADAKRGRADGGLSHSFWERDGRTEVLGMEGIESRTLRLANPDAVMGYFYFTLDPTFKEQDVSRVRIDVEYFDGPKGREGVFGLEYDATDAPNGSPSKALLPNVPFKGTGRWQTNSFHVRNGTFRNSQNAHSDFRLWARPAEFSVSRVTVTLEPEAPPVKALEFNGSGEAILTDWHFQPYGREQTVSARKTDETDHVRCLRITVTEGRGGGAWRTAQLLEAGEYRFTARARSTEPASANTAVLRVSTGRQPILPVKLTPEWAVLTHDFSMAEQGYVELVCDFSGTEGGVDFDLDSLKLIIRKPTPAP
jgi:hypothetical protein